MTYPDVSASKDLSLERLAEILKTVDLGYLLEREEVLTKEVNWDEKCHWVRSRGWPSRGSSTTARSSRCST